MESWVSSLILASFLPIFFALVPHSGLYEWAILGGPYLTHRDRCTLKF